MLSFETLGLAVCGFLRRRAGLGRDLPTADRHLRLGAASAEGALKRTKQLVEDVVPSPDSPDGSFGLRIGFLGLVRAKRGAPARMSNVGHC
jgi:hypothetical protein